ncbi:hypothetical protein DERF_013320 [Dermatophagoides farinae]|uniref:Uncharacterized protein n=1 Tax=Dermatophagoides farinae TaxID=6954 RepID=A0A922KW80_DERFA|nr:hypothetical protein DERF_013320 [Dermatophagoides farinae]
MKPEWKSYTSIDSSIFMMISLFQFSFISFSPEKQQQQQHSHLFGQLKTLNVQLAWQTPDSDKRNEHTARNNYNSRFGYELKRI